MNLQRYIEITNDCRLISDEMESEGFRELVARVNEGIRKVSHAWSGSWLGYQSHVYYRGLSTPSPGDHFSSEWGFEDAFSNPTSDNWIEVTQKYIEDAINQISGNPDLSKLRNRSTEIAKKFRSYQSELIALLTVDLETTKSEIIEELRDKAKKLKAFYSADEIASAKIPRGQIMTRDSLAMSQGLRIPPHIAVSSQIDSLSTSFHQIGELANIGETASNYLRQKYAPANAGLLSDGTVFIGHGRSDDWRELSAFIGDRLKLQWDEFNREPTAGLSIKERLETMLSQANFAFLVMTAEDEHKDESLHARENVIHEIGLFQGRLGFNRAIILLEEECKEFSNIHGIGQIRYPKGYLKATFEEIRGVLEREGVLATNC
jgi:predicted nucleotide-binding protein